MSIQHQIDNGIREGEEVRFLLAETEARPLGVPAGKMITDTANFSFVYLLDVEQGYRHLHFTQAVWPLMVDVLKSGVDPVLVWQDEVMPLPGFKEELTMLIYNIEGNDNYGEAFSTAVERAFSTMFDHID